MRRCFPLVIVFFLIVVGGTLSPTAASGYEITPTIDCEGTIQAWKNDPNYRDYAASCYCPSPSSAPVCGGGSSGSGGSSGYLSGANPNDPSFTLMQNFAQGFFSNLFSSPPSPAPGGGNKMSAPMYKPSPQYTEALRKLQSMRLPPEKAKFIMAEALRSQRQALRSYRPDDVLQQAALSRCLSLEAAERASGGSMEEASWLLRQGAFALSGDLVKAAPGSCPPVPGPPLNAGDGGNHVSPPAEQFKAAVQLLDRKRETWEKAKKSVGEAKKNLAEWEKTRVRISSEVDAAATEEEKKEKKASLEEVMKALAEAKEELANANNLEENSRKDFMEADRRARGDGSAMLREQR